MEYGTAGKAVVLPLSMGCVDGSNRPGRQRRNLRNGGSHAAALHRLGLGMHALADIESQAHFGFQSWGGDGPANIFGAIIHHNLESGVGKSHYQINCAATNLQNYYYEFLKEAGIVSAQ